MAEPTNRDSAEWLDWYIRHNFGGGQFVDIIKIISKQDDGLKKLNALVDYVNSIIPLREGEE